MYPDHFGLKEKPFEPTSNLKFVWLIKENAEALSIFKQTFLNEGGYLILSGDAGSGKKTLLHCFLKLIENKAITAVIKDPVADPLEFLNKVALGFRINRRFENRGEFLYYYKSLIENAYLNHLKLLIVIHEAQTLKPEVVRELNRLVNISINGRKPINAFLLIKRKKKKRLSAGSRNRSHKRLIVHHHLEPLSHENTYRFIKHRLKVAGADKQIFSKEAVYEIFKFSGGNPRLILAICDRALKKGYADGMSLINRLIVSECTSKLKTAKLTS